MKGSSCNMDFVEVGNWLFCEWLIESSLCGEWLVESSLCGGLFIESRTVWAMVK